MRRPRPRSARRVSVRVCTNSFAGGAEYRGETLASEGRREAGEAPRNRTAVVLGPVFWGLTETAGAAGSWSISGAIRSTATLTGSGSGGPAMTRPTTAIRRRSNSPCAIRGELLYHIARAVALP